MAQFKVVVNVTDKHGNPMIGLEVELVDTNAFTPANHDPIEHVADIKTTDISGTATFTGLTPSMYYARPRITRDDIRIQMMMPSGMGKLCYAALVQKDGLGTHTTIQSAITDLGVTGGVIFICGGTYTEDITVPVDTANLWLIGASRGECIIVGNLVTNAVLNHGISNFRMEHLTLNGNAGVALLFNLAPGAMPTTIDLLDLYIINATTGIDMSQGAQDVKIKDVDMASTVANAGQFECTRMDISDCRWLVSGIGPYIGGGMVISDVKISNSTFHGGASYAMRILNINEFLLSGCRFTSSGVGTTGIIIGNGSNYTVADSHIIVAEGKGIDASSAILVGLVLDGLQLESGMPQATDRIGVDIGANVQELVICGCRVKNFESYGIRLAATQNWVISETTVINGEDCHSIYLSGADYGVVTGCMLKGTGGANTTYGVYGAAGTTYVVIVANAERDHDGMTNLTNGVDGNVIGSNTGGSGSGMGPSPHVAVTLDVNADTLLSLSTQELGLDTQTANLVFSGPAAGGAAVPTFRSLVDADIPAAIMRDQEHTDIGDGAPHHAKYTDAEAIAAVEGEATLDLTGDVTIAGAKSLSVDTIGEKTGAAGVTIDTAKLKDSKIYPVAGDANMYFGKIDSNFFLQASAGDFIHYNVGLNKWYFYIGTAQEFTVNASAISAKSKPIQDVTDPTNDQDAATKKYLVDNAILKSLLTAKGDLIGASANDTPLILGVGADGEVLTADSGEATGLKWAAGGGGTPTLIEDADQDTKIQCEEGADEDIIRMDVAGTQRFVLQNASPHLLITGRLEITETAKVGTGGTGVIAPLLAASTAAIPARWCAAIYGYIAATGVDLGAGLVAGIYGGAVGQGTGASTYSVYGLYFQATHGSPTACPTLVGIEILMSTNAAGAGALTNAKGLNIPATTWTGASPNTSVGIDIAEQGGASVVNVYGLRIANQTATTINRLLEIGPATPYLRVVGGAAPAAGQSNVYISIGGTLKRVYETSGYLRCV